MNINFDHERLTIPCQACGKEISETLGRVKLDKRITCRHCGVANLIEPAQIVAIEAKIKKELDKLGATLKKLSK